MTDTNGDIPLTADPRVDAALKRIRGKFQDLEDAMLVQAHLEKRAWERIKEHAQALADHDKWMLHFQQKLDALTNIVMRRGGGPKTS
ncbi:MAG: hypothetical protein JOY54_08170 [Acidobacteriaceae bacterium]|nr:hypothetical protein [Acidobacteriaceae bacterium]